MNRTIREALTTVPDVLKNVVRPLAVVGVLGLTACSSGGETTVTTEASTTIETTSTTEALGGLAASGTVKCPDGMPVVGAWVETAQPDRGWADWKPHTGNPNAADYSRQLDRSVGYGLNVGCGGTPEYWNQNIQVDGLVAGIPATIVCEQSASSAPDTAYICFSDRP